MTVFALDKQLSISKHGLARHFVYELSIAGHDRPFYVGKGTRRNRPYAHLAQARRGDKSLKASIIRKAERDALQIVITIVSWSDSENEAFAEEARLIAHYGRRGIDTGGILANMTIGGEGRCGNSSTPETKAKMSIAHRGKIRSDQHCKSLSKAKIGHLVDEATRLKIAASLRGKTLSDEHKRKLIQALTGRRCADETRLKISVAHKGKNIPEDQRQRISLTLHGRERPEAATDAGSKTTRADAAKHVVKQIKSGVSQRTYCEANGIREQTFCGWKRSPYVIERLEAAGIDIPRHRVKGVSGISHKYCTDIHRKDGYAYV